LREAVWVDNHSKESFALIGDECIVDIQNLIFKAVLIKPENDLNGI
jgi:hypothetical protein